MNKKEIQSAITREACKLAESLGYIIEDDGFGGYLTFMKPNTKRHDDTIEWHRSYQEAVTLNWASDQVKLDAQHINAHMGPRIDYWNAQYQPKRATA